MSIVQTDLFGVNSLHHQEWTTWRGAYPDSKIARWIDRAVELPDHPFAIGVQWHPEKCRIPHDVRNFPGLYSSNIPNFTE